MNDFKPGDRVVNRRTLDGTNTVISVKYHYIFLDDGRSYDYREFLPVPDAVKELKARLDRLLTSDSELSEEELKYRTEVIEAFQRGKNLECRRVSGPDTWIALNHFTLRWNDFDYRIASEKEGMLPTKKEIQIMDASFKQYGNDFSFTFIKFKARNTDPFPMLESSISLTLRESHYVFNRKKGVWE